MSDEQDNYTVGGFRQFQKGQFEENPDRLIFPHTGFVRDEAIDRQLRMRAMHHDPDRWEGKAPASYLDVEKNRRIVRAEGGETAMRALDHGDTVSVKQFIGDPQQESDLAGIKAMLRLEEIVAGPAPVIVVLGEMGAGKTDFACLLGQLREHYVDGDLLVGSNIRSLKRKDQWVRPTGDVEDGWVPNYPLLDEWVHQDGDPLEQPQQNKLFVGDEFSSSGSGTGKQGHQVRKFMGPLVFKIRKHNGALIYIGHDESSIHPLLWRVGTIIKKTSKKTAVIAERVSNGKLRDVDDQELAGIPPTDWQYRTEEESEWSWNRPASAKDEPEQDLEDEAVKQVAMWTIKTCVRDEGMSANEASAYVPFSTTTVYNWLEDYDEGDSEKREWVENVERVMA